MSEIGMVPDYHGDAGENDCQICARKFRAGETVYEVAVMYKDRGGLQVYCRHVHPARFKMLVGSSCVKRDVPADSIIRKFKWTHPAP